GGGGCARFQPGFFEGRLQPAQDQPLDLFLLQDRLKVLLRSDMIDRIHAELKPGVQRGEALLRGTLSAEQRHNETFLH
ncbi:MAG: hypothetical protein AB1634_11240, partial [Thermodesulfobacteriota bacterium]